ncbi:MAG: hypothetical protein ACE5Q6_25775 [Dehalococcoidia bacterium]
MISVSAISHQTRSLWVRGGKWSQFLFFVAVGASLALISWQAGVLDGSTDIFGGVSDSAVEAGGPGAIVAFGAAFVIGVTMIVLPCGFPSVFAMPSILSSRKGLHQRATLSFIFLSASALPLAALGVGLSLGGDAVLGLLDTMKARMTFAVILYSALGVLAIAYALSQVGLFYLPNLLSRVSGPNMPDQDKPYRRSLVLGSTMGAGLGIGCPMPTYYILLGWVAAAANPLYGGLLLGLYGLGRVVPAVAIGALITAGMDRRKASKSMTSFREKTEWLTNGLVAAIGAYLIVLFGGGLLYTIVS